MADFLVSARVTCSSVSGTPIATLWNPSTTLSLWVTQVFAYGVSGHGNLVPTLKRQTTRGTPGSTVTPDADNDQQGEQAPPSGALLDLPAWSVAPTRDASELVRFQSFIAPGQPGSGNEEWFDRGPGIEVQPLTGLCLDGGGGSAVLDAIFGWREQT